MNEREIFIGAMQIPDPATRQAYLAETCGDDAALRRHLEGLLKIIEESGSFLEAGAPEVAGTIADRSTRPVDTRIGHYKLLQQIGEGGMGVVYMAEQTEPVARKVALKIIKPGMDLRQVIARFE